MKKTYWIERVKQGRKVVGYNVTDGIWRSRDYNTLSEARLAMARACWGEGVNTI